MSHLDWLRRAAQDTQRLTALPTSHSDVRKTLDPASSSCPGGLVIA
jgi:hypothetical protein